MFASLTLALVLSSPPVLANDTPVVSGLVGDADAVGKKKKAAKEEAKKGPSNKGNPAPSKPERAEAAGSDPPKPAERAKSKPAEKKRPENQRRRESTEHESAERRPEERHESGERHGNNSGHVAANRHTAAARHAPHTRMAAAAHRSAYHGHTSRHAAWAERHRPYRWYGPWRAGHPHHWYHGVFVYGPSVAYSGDGGGGSRGPSNAPKREVSRDGEWSVGLRGASYLSGFQDGSSYGDAGLGVAVRYRPIESLGFEAAWTYHDSAWSGEATRIQQPLQVSAQLFAFPWSRVSPYVLGGITMTDRNIAEPAVFGTTFETEQDLWGPHGGLGIEFGLGKSASLNFDARFIGYVNKPSDDPARTGALQANMGLNFYF